MFARLKYRIILYIITCMPENKPVSKVFVLKRIQYFLTLEMKQLYYNAYIPPTFDYWCIIWQNVDKKHTNRVLKCQKRIARIIYNGEKPTSTALIFKQYNWPTFPHRCKYFIGYCFYNSAHDLTPYSTYINGHFLN